MDRIHTITRLIEVSREYKRPLCFTLIDLKKVFDSNDIEAVMEELDSQGVPTQYIRILRELHKNFTTKISPFYNDINIDNVMRTLEWDNMEVKIDGRQLHYLRFVDDIVFIKPKIIEVERMLADFDRACGKTSLRLNLTKTMFMKNGLVSHTPLTLNGTNVSKCSSYIYSRSGNQYDEQLSSRDEQKKTGGLRSFQEHRGVVKRTRNTKLSHFFDSTVLPVLTNASETWSLRKEDDGHSALSNGESKGRC
ncbi:unnamed protein product [Angiostrongylus costaricensis]|uniref:Reverse transcriptase domain-containing protein n=1 Tax=Angiostrongylus costaricensis TaxID=334426 RepID=A0A0R3PYH9_ANGCS|nr:unnamed protein product [Angiostrongylus costaricensis]